MQARWITFFLGQTIFDLVAPIFVGISIGCLVPLKRIVTRIGIGLGAIFLSGFVAVFAVSGGAIAYSHGFEHALRTKVGFDRLQQWSQEALVRFQNGQIKSAGEPYFANPGDVLISTNDLPEFLKTGVFKPIDFNSEEPEVSVCKPGGRIGASQNCIAISWHLHGVLVGSSDFTNQWNPWYFKRNYTWSLCVLRDGIIFVMKLICFALKEEAAPFRKIAGGKSGITILLTGIGRAERREIHSRISEFL